MTQGKRILKNFGNKKSLRDIKNKSYVYRHRRLDNGVIFYIGIGKTKNYKRAFSKLQRNTHWKNTVKKSGYSVEIISENISWEDACELEILLIFEYGRRDLKTGNLVNLTDGGEGTVNRKYKESTYVKQSKSMSGKNNPNYGKKFSISHKNKIRASKLGSKNHCSKEVLNLETGIFYVSKTEAAIAHNINYSTLCDYLKGKYPNKTNLKLI